MSYEFLQQYWWLIVSLLGALLVFLLFVQGANSMVHSIGHTEEGQRKVLASTGLKWEITFTTLVTFGGAFFASFPLFYSTSFGGAYWLWMIILFSFVLQAVSYEFQMKKGNLLGTRTYRWFLVLNGIVGPLLLGGAVATFFNGYAVDPQTQQVFLSPMKYLHNYLSMPLLAAMTLVGVVLLLYGVGRTVVSKTYVRGIWPAGIGVVMVVFSLFLVAGLGNTAYYPSNADLQSSLTISNSCSSEFTLRTMFYVSLLVPFVFGYIAYVWRVMDRK